MQQKGRTEQILERMQELVNNGQGALTPGKVTLPREEISRLILELNMTVTTELKQYRDITDKRAKVLREAKRQAEDIIYEAEQSASRIRVTGRKTNVAPVRMLDLPESERRSLEDANEIYAASLIYTDEMMAEMQDVIDNALANITASYEYAIQDLQQKSRIIAENRAELMADLQSMETEDRYQQILEIGQLLSEELYHARRRALGEEDFPQMSLNLEGDAANQQEPVPSGQPVNQKADIASAIQNTANADKEAGIQNAVNANKEAGIQNAANADKASDNQNAAARQKQTPDDTADKMAGSRQAEGDTEKGTSGRNEAAEQSRPQTGKQEHNVEQPEQKPEKKPGYSVITDMDDRLQREVAASVASALEEKKKVEVAEITEEVSEAVKHETQQSLSGSVISAMKRAAKKAVLGMDEDEDDLFADEDIDDDELIASWRSPTQPLDTQEVNRRAKASGEASGNREADKQELTPEQLREQQHRAFVEAHKQKVKEEEEKWLNAVYDSVIPDPNAVDPIVEMALKEKLAAKKEPDTAE